MTDKPILFIMKYHLIIPVYNLNVINQYITFVIYTIVSSFSVKIFDIK